MKEVADILRDRGNVIEQMRALSKANPDGFSAEQREQYEKLDAAQNSLKEQADRLTREAELSAELNASYGKPVGNDGAKAGNGIQSKEYKAALDQYIRRNSYSNALRVGENTEGGYLTHDEFNMQFREIRDHYNALRPLVEVITTTGEHNIRVETDLGESDWLDENAAYTGVESDPAFGNVQLRAHKLGRMTRVSEELLQDSDFNVEAYLARAFGRSHGLAEERAFLTGSGTGRPTGMVGTATAVTTSETAVTADALLDTYHGLPVPYRSMATWILHDGTVRTIRGLTDDNDNFIWQPGLQPGQPDRILGRPYIVSAYMTQAGASPVTAAALFGDLKVYVIADRTQFRIQRLNELYAGNGQVGFRGWSRLDGKLSQPAGLVKLVL